MPKHAVVIAVFLFAPVVVAQQSEPARVATLPESRPTAEARYEKLGDLPGVQAVVKFSDRFYRGAQPKDLSGMLELKKRGVSVILSVEEPEQAEIDAATQAGIKVINVPTEYNGLPAAVINDLVTKYREIDGTVFAHCHHGKHRGGAAGAIIRMTFEGIPQLEAIQEMAELGCSKRYPGLYESIGKYRPNPATAHRVLKPRPGIDGLIEVTPWILRGTSTMTPEAVAALKDLGVRSILSADMSSEAQGRVRAAGMTVVVLPVTPGRPTADERDVIVKALRDRKQEKVFVHATDDVAKVGAVIAYFRIDLSHWSPEEAAGEVEALVPGASGSNLAKAVRSLGVAGKP